MNEGEFPSSIEIEGLTGVPWAEKTQPLATRRYRVEAVARGRGILHDVPVVFFSALPKPDVIEAMTLMEFRQTMTPIHGK